VATGFSARTRRPRSRSARTMRLVTYVLPTSVPVAVTKNAVNGTPFVWMTPSRGRASRRKRGGRPACVFSSGGGQERCDGFRRGEHVLGPMRRREREAQARGAERHGRRPDRRDEEALPLEGGARRERARAEERRGGTERRGRRRREHRNKEGH